MTINKTSFYKGLHFKNFHALPDIEEIFTLSRMWICYWIVQPALTGLKLQIEKFSF
jgi:hypothetical protein